MSACPLIRQIAQVYGLESFDLIQLGRRTSDMILFPILLTFLARYSVLASSVVSVDANDSSIQYSGSGWEPSSQHLNSLDFGGGHAVSTIITDTATFTFTGAHITI